MRRATLIAHVLLALGCAGVGAAPAPDDPPGSPDRTPATPAPRGSPGANLRPSAALRTDCYGWPAEPWSKRNKAGKPTTFLGVGDAAVDFTLKDRDGEPHALRDLLETKPVLLVQGSYTCPRHQENEPGLAAIARRYAGDLHTVLVYNIEAHPRAEASPYAGQPREHAFSDRPQATDYATRVRYAGDVDLPGEVLVLVDALGDRGSNPVWCTYGTCASCAWLIARDGTIEAVHPWHDPATMNGSIDALLGR